MHQHSIQWYVNIDGAFYAVCTAEPGQGWKLLQLQGRRPGAMYDVQLAAGRIACNCPDGINQVHCKHVEALRALDTLPQRSGRAAPG